MPVHISAAFIHPGLLHGALVVPSVPNISWVYMNGGGGKGRIPLYNDKLGCSLCLVKSKYLGGRELY